MQGGWFNVQMPYEHEHGRHQFTGAMGLRDHGGAIYRAIGGIYHQTTGGRQWCVADLGSDRGRGYVSQHPERHR